MRPRRLITTALGTVLALACLPAFASAQVSGQIATPSGLDFKPSAVPNLERDCGATASSAPAPVADARGANPRSPNPLATSSFFVDPTERSYKDLQIYRSRGQAANASAMENLALQPKAHWFGRFTRPRMQRKVGNYLNCVQRFQPGATPLLIVMRHQGKECNSRYTAGGVAEDNLSKQWYRDFAQAVGDKRVVIGFEPDSIGTISCLAKSRRKARKDLLRYGVDVLSELPNATIYLEATASDWKSPAYTAGLLRYIGISKVRGFMLNVFCNPRYRGLGPKTNTNTGIAGVDGFLYLNRPGVSGAGTCNGGFKAGEWWADRALMYAKYASDQLGPQRGQRFGLPFRVSLCALGAPVKGESTYSSVSPEKRCRK